MLRTMRLGVGALVVLAGGVALAQPNADGLFPLKKGSKWVYKVSDQTVEVEVAGTEKVGSADAVKLSTKVNGKEVATELVEVRADGVYRLAVKGEKIEPPVKFLAIPAKKGDKWKVDSKVSNQAVKGEFTVADDKAKVKVPAGEFEAVYVEGPDFEESPA